MPSRHHVIVKKPFDHYDRAGVPAVLSQNGYDRFKSSKKADFIEHVAEEREDGRIVIDGKTLDYEQSRALIQADGFLVDDAKAKAGKAPKTDRQAAGPSAAR